MAAVSDGNDIRVYFQDEASVMREWGATFDAHESWLVQMYAIPPRIYRLTNVQGV